jgi:hypothetical protein
VAGFGVTVLLFKDNTEKNVGLFSDKMFAIVPDTW